MHRKELRKLQKTAVALTSSLAILAGCMTVPADDFDDDIMSDDSDYSDDSGGSVDAGGGSLEMEDSPFLIEDSGEDVQYNAGVPMDTLQDAMDSGDEKTLKKIASLGALTGGTTTSGSGVGGGGAYRGANEAGEDDEEYYDLQLDEGDADEVETEKPKLNESPGQLTAANPDRVQEYLDSMLEVDNPTGSDGELTVAAYIETKLGEMGYTVQEQAFHEGVLNEDGIDAPGVNILAERGANSQTNRKSDIFLVVTHYDSKRSPAEDDPFANDKSGAAALIEAARILSGVVTDTDICFLFLSGQEDGGYGAQNFISSLSEENRSRISGVLSVERVGYDADTPYVLKTLTGESNSLGDMVRQLGLTNDAYLSRQPEEEDDDDEDGTWVAVGQSSDGYIDERTAEQMAAEQSGESLPDDHAIDIESAEYLDEDWDDLELDEAETEGEPVPMPSAWSYLKDNSVTLSSFADYSCPAVTVSQYMPDLDGESYEETKALGLAGSTQEEAGQEETAETSAGTNAEGFVQLEDSNLTGSAREAADAQEDFVRLEDSNLTGSADEASAAGEGSAVGTDGQQEDYDLPGMEAGMDEEDPDYPLVDADRVADTTNVIAAALAQIMDPAT